MKSNMALKDSIDFDKYWNGFRKDVKEYLDLECLTPEDVPRMLNLNYHSRSERFKRAKDELAKICGIDAKEDRDVNLPMYDMAFTYLLYAFNFEDDSQS